jgi:prepilin-type processing-associated H-X9-DG protein
MIVATATNLPDNTIHKDHCVAQASGGLFGLKQTRQLAPSVSVPHLFTIEEECMLHEPSVHPWRRRGSWMAFLTGALLLTASQPRAEVPLGNAKPADPAKRRFFQKEEAEKQASFRKESQNNLKQLGLALHCLHDVYAEFPGPAILSKKDGKPLLSWRVAILPYIEEEALYKQFKLDEPWDSPHNIKLLDKMPKVFAVPGVKTTTSNATFYQAIVGKDAAWQIIPNKNKAFGAQGARIANFLDGTSNTILLVEGAEPVPWTRPADTTYDAKKPLPKFGWLKSGFNVLMADGSVRFINRGIIFEATLRAAITPAGGEVLGNDWNDPKGMQP